MSLLETDPIPRERLLELLPFNWPWLEFRLKKLERVDPITVRIVRRLLESSKIALDDPPGPVVSFEHYDKRVAEFTFEIARLRQENRQLGNLVELDNSRRMAEHFEAVRAKVDDPERH